jgi:hypothetical protein
MLNHKRFACTTEHYDHLYARYLKNPEKLLEMAHFHPSHHLLDLCGGTGAIANQALTLGADPRNITLIDLNSRCRNPHIRQLSGHVLYLLRQLTIEGIKFDTIVCRQAIAYLEIENKSGEELAQRLAMLMPEGGCFIFNTFIRPRYYAKTYHYQGQRFIELAGYLKRRVFRLQINLNIGCDISISKWHREERLYEIFNPWFQIEIRWSEKAVYWLCTRRSKHTLNLGKNNA